MKPLTFPEISEASESRSNKWIPGGIHGWTPERWSNALAGEAGEVCNAVKKLNRIEDGLTGNNQGATAEEQIEKIGEEIADLILYAVPLALRLGIDIDAKVRDKFNSTSIKYGFPERL